MQNRVLIGMPCGSGLVPTQTLQAMLQLKKPCETGFICVDRQRTDKARNYLASECVKGGFSHLLMVDDDNPIPADALEKMLGDDKDIVVAPILSRNPGATGRHDLCAFYKEDCVFNGEALRLYNPIMGFREEGPLHRIDAGGTGCILIKVSAIEAVIEKFSGEPFAYTDVTVGGQRRTMSEDVEFCERASDLGFEIWLDDRIRPIHLTRMGAVQWKQ